MTHFSAVPDQCPIDSDSRPVVDPSELQQPGISGGFKTTHPQPLSAQVAQFEASVIQDALRACGGNQAKTAQVLGVAPNTLHYKIKRLGLVPARKQRRHAVASLAESPDTAPSITSPSVKSANACP